MKTLAQQIPLFPDDLPADLSDARYVWLVGAWHFSVIDFVRALTDTKNAARYWSDLKRKLDRETDVYEIFVSVEMPDSAGRMQSTDVATRMGLLRIVQSMPSNKVTGEKVERIKLWLAKTGAQAIEDELNPERAVQRFEGKISRKAFMEAIRNKLNPPQYIYAQATNDVYRGVFHRDHKALCRELETNSPRDRMDGIGLSYLRIAEAICARHLGSAQELTLSEARDLWIRVSTLIGHQVDAVEQDTGFDAVTGRKLLGPIDAIKGA